MGDIEDSGRRGMERSHNIMRRHAESMTASKVPSTGRIANGHIFLATQLCAKRQVCHQLAMA